MSAASFNLQREGFFTPFSSSYIWFYSISDYKRVGFRYCILFDIGLSYVNSMFFFIQNISAWIIVDVDALRIYTAVFIHICSYSYEIKCHPCLFSQVRSWPSLASGFPSRCWPVSWWTAARWGTSSSWESRLTGSTKSGKTRKNRLIEGDAKCRRLKQ